MNQVVLLPQAVVIHIEHARRNRVTKARLRDEIERRIDLSIANRDHNRFWYLQAMLAHLNPLHAAIDPERHTRQDPLLPFAIAVTTPSTAQTATTATTTSPSSSASA